MRGLSVGIDVGGTFVKFGLVDAKGEIIRSEQIPTEAKRGPADFVRRAKAILKRADWKHETMGLALAGGVDSKSGELLFVPNLRGWDGFSFKKAFGPHTAVENDANAAIWGGYVVGLKRKARNVVGITLGTGVGGGLIFDGKLYHGTHGYAGEIGHQTLELEGPLCACGRRGCLEAYAGTAGILRIALEHMQSAPDPLTPKAIADAALAGDKGAKKAWDEVGTRLGLGISNAVLLLNPDAVLLVGGVARAGSLLLDPVRRVFKAQSFPEPFKGLTVSAPAERDWGVVGAALLSREDAV